MIFIGAHSRRTDFVEHYKLLAHGSLVDHNHFDNSFEVFRSNISGQKMIKPSQFLRSRFNDENNRVIFLAVSDDSQWMKV